MAQLIVRNVEEGTKARLKRRATRRGRSLEEEVRCILRDAVKDEGRPAGGLGSRVAACFRGAGLAEDLPEVRGGRPHPADLGA
jgi:plasmid stability protein